ncbi:MAG: DegT/DnrJ/EryC1/StrS family aminotransferase [Bacteroidota bacterium]|nr:DegT/DnrJ/EryC1/StrS family aminotransferase [Bacteroidota bacterium]
MINVTKTFLPPFAEYTTILKRAWDKAWITNNGELVQELEAKLKEYLGVKHLFFTSNGTIVLQMALKAYNITKDVITTPFSYVATTNAILWEGCQPVFVDINKRNFCIDADKIEAAITENTQAIMATHVFGLPCEVEKIEKIAQKHNLKLIYDAAHAFGCSYKGKSLVSYGDISTCSFHATKIFHTVEGGCIITEDDEVARKLMLYRQFGHVGDDYFTIGINGKNSEFHAAMGLSVLPKVGDIISTRKRICAYYNRQLSPAIGRIELPADLAYNYAYFPVLFESEDSLIRVFEALKKQDILCRRYFYPSLNTLPFHTVKVACTISDDISLRILCLPLFYDISQPDLDRIISIINTTI